MRPSSCSSCIGSVNMRLCSCSSSVGLDNVRPCSCSSCIGPDNMGPCSCSSCIGSDIMRPCSCSSSIRQYETLQLQQLYRFRHSRSHVDRVTVSLYRSIDPEPSSVYFILTLHCQTILTDNAGRFTVVNLVVLCSSNS